MKILRKVMIVLISFFQLAIAPHVHSANWSEYNIDKLVGWVDGAPKDALPLLSKDYLDTARRGDNAAEVDRAASALALRLARAHLLGSASRAERTGWHITDTDRDIDLESWLDRALAGDAIDTFFTALRPKHPDYAALRAAYQSESDPARRQTLARNMERWRWLPRSLGDDFVLVNAAFFEAHLWRDGAPAGTWRVIVGKRSTPTPVFSTTITGVTLNPWWNIPASIVREKRGNFPSRLGYVYSDGRWRQKPGPNNALGQMKLVMPNPYSVFMHDTPSKRLFERDVRAFSHGCIRTGDAIGFAATLLEGVKSREEVDAIVARGRSKTIDLARPLPLYVTYFTAAAGADGTVVIQPDIYNRDGRVGDMANPNRACAV